MLVRVISRRIPSIPSAPGPNLLGEEAELFPSVTEASAEPETGVIPPDQLIKLNSGNFSSHMEVDIGISRLGGMGRLTDGFNHPTSTSKSNNSIVAISNKGHDKEHLGKSGTASGPAHNGPFS